MNRKREEETQFMMSIYLVCENLHKKSVSPVNRKRGEEGKSDTEDDESESEVEDDNEGRQYALYESVVEFVFCCFIWLQGSIMPFILFSH